MGRSGLSAIELMVLLTGSLALCTATMSVMSRALRSQQRMIDRRRQEWVDSGRRPEDEPHFGGCAGS